MFIGSLKNVFATVVGLVSIATWTPTTVWAQSAAARTSVTAARTDRDRALVCEVRGLYQDTNGDGTTSGPPRQRRGTVRVWLLGERDARFEFAGHTGFLRTIDGRLTFERAERAVDGSADYSTTLHFDPALMRVEGQLTNVTYVRIDNGRSWTGEWREHWEWAGACAPAGA